MLAKALGFWMLHALVMGTMIGSGIFMIPAALAPYGIWGTVAWLTSAIGVLSIMVPYLYVTMAHILLMLKYKKQFSNRRIVFLSFYFIHRLCLYHLDVYML